MGTNAGWTGCPVNIPTGAGGGSKAKGKGCMELGREPGGREAWMMGALDMLGPVIVGMDMEGREIGGPDTGGPGMRGTEDMDMGGMGNGACEGTRGLEAPAGGGTEDTEVD